MVLLVFALIAAAGGTHAHEVRFIASYGDNANDCTRTAPCLTLLRGKQSTPPGGELIILDSGDFGGGASIGKSITISAAGVSATIGGPITINDAGATVVLRGLRLNGVNAGINMSGINVLAAAAVYIEDCEVQNFDDHGIIATAADVKLFVSGSVSRGNGIDGLNFVSGVGLVIDNSRFERNGNHGLRITGAEATITKTVASANIQHGVLLLDSSTNVTRTTAEHNGGNGYYVSSGQMVLERSVARGNGDYGLYAVNSTAVVSNSVLTNNNVGLFREATAAILTRGNNMVSGNSTDVSGALTPLSGI